MAPPERRSRLWPWFAAVAVAALLVALLLISTRKHDREELTWPSVRFVDVTESAGIRFVHTSGAVYAFAPSRSTLAHLARRRSSGKGDQVKRRNPVEPPGPDGQTLSPEPLPQVSPRPIY